MNQAFLSWGHFVVRRRWLVLLAVLGLSAASVFTIGKKLRVDNSIEAFASSSEGDVQLILEQFRDEFGRDDAFLVLIEGDVFSMEYLEKLRKVHQEIAALNLDLPTLGERKRDRDILRGKDVPPVAEKKPAKAPSESAPAAGADEFDEFADFDEDMGEDFGDEEGDKAWGDEAGGSIVDEVTSVINARRTRGIDGTLDVGDWMKPFPKDQAQADALKAEMLGDSTLVGRVLGADGKLSALVVRTHFMSEQDSHKVNEAIQAIMDKYAGDDFRYHMAGLPALSAALNELMLGDMQGLFGYGLVVLLLILGLMFRHPIGFLSPMMVVGASSIWAFGVMAALGMPMTMMSNILPAFFICVGVADSVHLISVYRSGRAAGLDNDTAIAEAVGSTGTPIFFTSLTTAMGLISFEFASVDAIGEMGRTGAFGVAMAFLNTVTLLPAVLTFNKKSLLGLKPHKRDWIDTVIDWQVGLSATVSGRRKTLIGATLITSAALYGAAQLYVWHNPLSWVPDDKPVKIAVNIADTKLGGTSQIQLLIEGTGEHGVKDVRLLKGLEKLEKHVRDYVDPKTGDRIVGNTISVLDVIRETNKALHNDDEAYNRIPDSQQEASHLFVAFENSSPDDLKRLMTIDASTAQMTIMLKWLEATSYGPLTEHLEAGVAKFMPDAEVSVVKPTGAAYVLLTTVSALIGDMIRSFGIAFVIITFIMIALLKDLKLGLVAMVPNLTPIAYILGLMGFADIPIDMANLMIASIALGIAVDDTIHFLHHFKQHYDQTGDVESSIAHSVKHSGRALVITSIILAGGFFVYMAATMYSLQRFGLLIGLTVIFAVVLDLILAPAILRTLYRNKSQNQINSPKNDGGPSETTHSLAAQ